MTLDDNFHTRLMATRAEKGMSQAELADKAGIAPAQLSRYESGRNKPRGEIVARLARALEVSMQWLCTGDIPFDEGRGPQLTFSLPDTLHQLVAAEALRENRSVPQEIIERLELTFADQGGYRQPPTLQEAIRVFEEEAEKMGASFQLMFSKPGSRDKPDKPSESTEPTDPQKPAVKRIVRPAKK